MDEWRQHPRVKLLEGVSGTMINWQNCLTGAKKLCPKKKGYCANKLTAQRQNSFYSRGEECIDFPFEHLDLPCMWHSRTHQSNVLLYCQLPRSPNLHTYCRLKAKKNTLFFFLLFVLQSPLISLSGCLSSVSAPVHFPPLRTRKEVDRNKAAYSLKSPKEVLPLSQTTELCLQSHTKKNGG